LTRRDGVNSSLYLHLLNICAHHGALLAYRNLGKPRNTRFCPVE
jgi:hypothetical protein